MLVFSKLVSLMRVLKYCGPSSDFSRNILLGVDDGLSEARCRIRTIFCPPPLLREGFLLFPSAVGAILVRLFLSYYVWPTHAPSRAAAARPKSSEFYRPNKHTSNMYLNSTYPRPLMLLKVFC